MSELNIIIQEMDLYYYNILLSVILVHQVWLNIPCMAPPNFTMGSGLITCNKLHPTVYKVFILYTKCSLNPIHTHFGKNHLPTSPAVLKEI